MPPPQKLAPLVDSEFDVDYDFAIKHNLIQSDDGVVDFHAMPKLF